MKARRWERVGSLLGLLLLILSLLLSTLIDPVAGGSSSSSKQREQKKSGEQQKRPISLGLSSSSSSGQKNPSQNSTMRNTRQIPEIPALYSAPKPDIPALYSAPKINQKAGQDQNEVDYDQMRATTEVTMIADDEEESPEENSSVDYQYGVPTEKYGVPSVEEGEVISDYPTDSPLPTSKSNEVDQKSENDETDSYNQGYNNNREPSPQYGAPLPPRPQYGAPASPSQQQQPPAPPPPKNGRGRESSKRKMYSTPNRRPADQQQIENSLQPTTQMRPNQESSNGGPQQEGYYLPPSKSEQKPGGDQRNEKNAYGADPNQYPQSKPTSYQAPQPQPQQKQQPPKNGGYGGGEPQPSQQHRSSEGYPSSGPLPQEPSQQRSGIFPQQDSENPQQGQQNPSQQGQYFGRDASNSQQQPNSFYGAPGVNHFDSGSQDELEGLNEKIVDAELLQRVQQIIEDHERQQKVLLDNIQKDNEKAYLPPQPPSSSSGYPTASGPSTFTGNELNGPNDFTAPAAGGGGYTPDFQSPNYNRYNSNGVASGDNNENGGAGAPDTARSPSYFNSINDVPSSNSGYPNNDYSNSNSYQSGGNSYNQNQKQPQQASGGYPQPSSGRDNNNGVGSGSPSSSYPGGYKNSQPENRQETQPDPQYSKSTGSSGGYQQQQQRQGDEQQKLNSIAGPGEEYLPPVPQNRQLEQQQQYELPRNVQNVGYSNSFPADSQVQASNARTNGEEQGYSVKVGTGILVSDGGGQPIPSYNYGSLPPQPSSFSSPQRNFQDGSSAPGVFANGERFPQPVQSPSPNPSFWSRGNLSPQPQANYGAPLNQEVDNRSQQPATSSGVGEQGSLQIKYSNPGLSGAGGNQGSAFVQPQYGPPTTPFNNNNPAQQPYNGVVDNPNGNVMIAIPRPIYGVPLAPVITLDSDNNLPGFNGSPAGGELSYSPDAIKTSTPIQTGNEYALDQGLLGQGRFDQAAPGANYLPPSQYNGSPVSIGTEDLSNSLHLQSSPPSSNDVGPSASYGIRDNNPSSSSSAYLSIQGHGGNSNNHIYNINHNGYGSSSNSFGIGTSLADPSSIIIPGLSNTFTLPVYDYSPTSPHHQNGDDELSAAASSSALSTSPVVVPLEHLLEQLQAASHSGSPTIYYGSSAGQDNVRVLRRALSKTGNVSAAPPNPIPEQLGTSRRSSNNNNDSKSSHPPSSFTSSSSQPKTNSHLPRRRT